MIYLSLDVDDFLEVELEVEELVEGEVATLLAWITPSPRHAFMAALSVSKVIKNEEAVLDFLEVVVDFDKRRTRLLLLLLLLFESSSSVYTTKLL